MNRTRAIRLFELLQSSGCCPAFSRVGPATTGVDPEIEHFAQAISDPEFGIKFVRSLVDQGKPLPPEVQEPELQRVYRFYRFGTQDQDVLEALALTRKPCLLARVITNCLLLCRSYSYAEIAGRVARSEAAVRIYAMLFCPVRDREDLFTLQLVYPQSRQCEFEAGYAHKESWEKLAYRIAYNYGMTSAECFLGLTTRTPALNVNELMSINQRNDQLADQAIHRMLNQMHFYLDAGFDHQDLPALKNAIPLLRLVKSQRDRQHKSCSEDLNAARVTVAVSQALSKPSKTIEHILQAAAERSRKASPGQDGKPLASQKPNRANELQPVVASAASSEDAKSGICRPWRPEKNVKIGVQALRNRQDAPGIAANRDCRPADLPVKI